MWKVIIAALALCALVFVFFQPAKAQEECNSLLDLSNFYMQAAVKYDVRIKGYAWDGSPEEDILVVYVVSSANDTQAVLYRFKAGCQQPVTQLRRNGPLIQMQQAWFEIIEFNETVKTNIENSAEIFDHIPGKAS